MRVSCLPPFFHFFFFCSLLVHLSLPLSISLPLSPCHCLLVVTAVGGKTRKQRAKCHLIPPSAAAINMPLSWLTPARSLPPFLSHPLYGTSSPTSMKHTSAYMPLHRLRALVFNYTRRPGKLLQTSVHILATCEALFFNCPEQHNCSLW